MQKNVLGLSYIDGFIWLYLFVMMCCTCIPTCSCRPNKPNKNSRPKCKVVCYWNF